eukprot:6196073-Pleurochrysis_carterae.AAC.1
MTFAGSRKMSSSQLSESPTRQSRAPSTLSLGRAVSAAPLSPSKTARSLGYVTLKERLQECEETLKIERDRADNAEQRETLLREEKEAMVAEWQQLVRKTKDRSSAEKVCSHSRA